MILILLEDHHTDTGANKMQWNLWAAQPAFLSSKNATSPWKSSSTDVTLCDLNTDQDGGG